MRISLILVILSTWSFCNAQLTDNEYYKKLQAVQNIVPLEINQETKLELSRYAEISNQNLQKTLNRFTQYDSAFQVIFSNYNVPLELRFASISFTDFDNTNGSYQGREGVFNLTYRVAKRRGINITNFVDERRDILKAAEVFCQEISAVNAQVQDWRKALIIYGSSDLDWQRARITSKDSTNDIWLINKYLNSEYSKILPKFVAAVYFGNYYQDHGYLALPVIPDTESVVIQKPVTFDHLGKELQLDAKKLAELNPIFKKGIVPKSENTYSINLPSEKVELFYELGDSIYGIQKPVVQTAEVDLSSATTIDAPSKPKPVPTKKYATLIYRVKSGDNLILIADIYDITVSSLKAQNRLRGSRINVNQRLYVKVPIGKKAYYMKMNRMSMAQKKAQARRD